MYVEKLPDPETRVILGTVSAIFAYVFTVGPHSWRTTSGVVPLLERGHISVIVYGVALAVAVALQLCPGRPIVRFMGYLLSAICFTTFFLLIGFNTRFGTNSSGFTPLGLALYFETAAMYWLSARRVIFVQGGRHDGPAQEG